MALAFCFLWVRKAKDRQIEDKLQLLRRDAAKHRRQAEQAQLLRFQMSNSRTWTSLLDSFLRCHEKHSTFTMMQLRALDQHDRVPWLHFHEVHNRFTVTSPKHHRFFMILYDSFIFWFAHWLQAWKTPRLWVWRKISRSAKLTPLKCVRLGSVPCAQKSAAKRPILKPCERHRV